jgi:hypothetical protein
VQQTLEEALGSRAVSSILHQNVEYHPVLVDRAPQIVQHTADADEHLIQVPGIAGLRSSPAQPPREIGTEVQAPMSDALVCHDDASFGQDQLDVAQAEAEYVIPPDGIADDLGRKPMPRICRGLVGHAVSFACLPLKRHQQLTCQMPLDRHREAPGADLRMLIRQVESALGWRVTTAVDEPVNGMDAAAELARNVRDGLRERHFIQRG